MRALVAIVRREIRERRQILVAAGVAAVIPIVLPALRRLSPDAQGWASLLIALVFALGIAASLGAASLVPRIANRRIAFDLSRPVSAAVIWIGSVAAATILALVAAAIVWIPAHLVGARAVWSELVGEPSLSRIGLLAAVAAVPVLFAVAHAVILMFRSRSARLAGDAVLGAASVLGVSAALSRLPEFFASGPRILCLAGVGVAAAVAFLVAGHASVSRGRTEIRAAHGALSTTLWGVMVPAVIAANAYAAWVIAASPRSVAASTDGFWVQPSPSGSWVQLSGEARGADARFLYDTASGRSLRAQTVDWRGPAVSRDGRWAAWIEGRDRGEQLPVRTLRLDRPEARPVVTRLLMNTYPYLLVLSADGSRLATWEQGMLSVHDLGAERTLASARVPVGERERLVGVFLARDAFRLFRLGDRSIDVLELDVATRSLAPRGRVEASAGVRHSIVDAEGSRLVTVEGAERRVRLYDASNGSLIATLADAAADSRWPVFLPDRRLVVSEKVSNERSLRVFAADGSPQKAIPLPAMAALTIGGEPAPGLVCLGFGDARYRYAAWVVSIDDGTLRKIADDLRPLPLGSTTPDLGSDATKLFYGPGQRSLVRLDPQTGERRTVLGTP